MDSLGNESCEGGGLLLSRLMKILLLIFTPGKDLGRVTPCHHFYLIWWWMCSPECLIKLLIKAMLLA
jgi:hypothetical protein